MIIARKYEVLGEIGRGGMGVVYKVRHIGLDTIYALKTLPMDLAASDDFIARFHREARVMAQLQHPNIVRVLDVDRDADLQYFVMEYVNGRSLAELIRREGPRSLSEVVEIASPIALALGYAHGHDPAVIHRDVKPSNILMEDRTRRIVVTDFGIAKLTGCHESLRTSSGEFLGTLKYCAPEQVEGDREIDGRADIYSLGLVMHELFTGRHVFASLEHAQIVGRLLNQPTEPVLDLSRVLPEDFRTLLERATAKNREERYADANQLLAALRGVLARLNVAGGKTAVAEHPPLAPVRDRTSSPAQLDETTRTSRRRRTTLAAVCAAIIVISGIAGFWVRTRASSLGVAVTALNARSGTESVADSATRAVDKSDAGAERDAPKAVGVMDFVAWAGDPQLKWMCDAIRDTLNIQLSKAPKLKVFSKDFIDFKAQGLVRQGTFPDVKLATMQVAQELGVAKAVFGSFRTDKDRLYIQAHIVDMATGVQTESDSVEGEQSNFSELQASLASKLMARLGVRVPMSGATEVSSVPASSGLDNYKLLLEADGAAPTDGKTTQPPRLDRHGSRLRDGVLLGHDEHLRWWTPAVACADDHLTGGQGDAEAAIRQVLQRYREAYEKKDLGLLGEVYESLTPAQVEANTRYFNNAQDLMVAIDVDDIAVGDDRAAVSYTRKDNFVDATTNQKVTLEVRLTKIMVRRGGAWKIAAVQK